jgi:cell division septal protein FtsQ
MERPNWQQEIDERLRDLDRRERWFIRWVVIPTLLVLALGAWLGWFPI